MNDFPRTYIDYSLDQLGKEIYLNKRNKKTLYRLKHELSFRIEDKDTELLIKELHNFLIHNSRIERFEDYYVKVREDLFLGNYIPKWTQKEDSFTNRILNFKNGNLNEIKYFEDLIFKKWKFIDRNIFTLCRVPSSDKENIYTSCNILIKNIINRSIQNHRDGSLCLERYISTSPQHRSKRRLSIDEHSETLRIRDESLDLIEYKNIILFDDVTTSKNTINACTELLLLNKANRVIQAPLAKTIRIYL